jgi:hypothetical protein
MEATKENASSSAKTWMDGNGRRKIAVRFDVAAVFAPGISDIHTRTN